MLHIKSDWVGNGTPRLIANKNIDIVVEQTSGATVEAGLGVDGHVNGSCAVPHR